MVSDGTDREHADVVHHEVDASEPLERDVARRLEVGDARDIAANGDGCVADLVGDGVRPFLVEIGDDDLRASASEAHAPSHDRSHFPRPSARPRFG